MAGGILMGGYNPMGNTGVAGGYQSPYGSANMVNQAFMMGRTPAGGTFAGPGGAPSGPSDPITGSYDLYNKAVEQQAGDYGDIMKNYKDMYSKLSSLTPGQVNPQFYNYSPSSDVTSSLSNLKGLSETGGYSEADINNLRERGISPIRAVYANAQRNIDRNRALSGGYSPSYNAVTAKMTRELSDQIANQTTNVNAGLAERIAQNKLSIAPSYSSAAEAENALRNSYGAKNTDIANQAQFYNAEQPLKFAQAAMAPLQGMTSLYGTTPALANTFGNQALNAAQLQNQITQQNKQSDRSMISPFMSGMRLG